MVPGPMGGPAARASGGTVCKPELARACLSHESLRREKEKNKKTNTHTKNNTSCKARRGRQGAAPGQARPTAAGTMVPMVLMVPGVSRSSLELAALSPRSAGRGSSIAWCALGSCALAFALGAACGFTWLSAQHAPCVALNNCARFLVVFSFCF
jgi:hypothetical protein